MKQVQPAPSVTVPKPELKSDPNEQTSTDIAPLESEVKKTGVKLAFSFDKKQQTTAASRSTLDEVFGGEEESDEVKPKKKVYTLMANPNSAHIMKSSIL